LIGVYFQTLEFRLVWNRLAVTNTLTYYGALA
jgi:hypothetical protein